jgi:hypothetical protein
MGPVDGDQQASALGATPGAGATREHWTPGQRAPRRGHLRSRTANSRPPIIARFLWNWMRCCFRATGSSTDQ